MTMIVRHVLVLEEKDREAERTRWRALALRGPDRSISRRERDRVTDEERREALIEVSKLSM